MGILAKKNMLYILTFGIFVCLLTPVLIFADEQRVDFFEEINNYTQKENCSKCSEELIIINPKLKGKSEEIEKAVYNNFVRKETLLNNEIILFVDPDCRFSDAAVKTLVKFKKDFPNWNVKGVIVTDTVNLKEKIKSKKSYFSNDIEFSIDLNKNLAKQFDITKIPTYVITYYGRYYRIMGQPDLNGILSKLDK